MVLKDAEKDRLKQQSEDKKSIKVGLTSKRCRFILSYICEKAMTKRVIHWRKPQRAGVGGNRYEYLMYEDHFQAAT